jgi:hypothetical protein
LTSLLTGKIQGIFSKNRPETASHVAAFSRKIRSLGS